MRFRVFGRVVYVPSTFLVVAILALIVIATVFGYILSKDESSVIVSSTPEPSKTTEVVPTEQVLISVHIIGCVNERKVVKVPLGSNVEDVVKAAGGFTANADKDAVNLAFKVSDGIQIKIPSKDEIDKTWIISSSGNPNEQGNNTGKVSINKATLNELMTLPGIGQSLAKSIIDYREKNNGFKTVEEIMQVPGIKEAKYESLKDYITL